MDMGPLPLDRACDKEAAAVAGFQLDVAEHAPDRLGHVTIGVPPGQSLIESEHLQHAVVELTIRDLKDQALAHFPADKDHPGRR